MKREVPGMWFRRFGRSLIRRVGVVPAPVGLGEQGGWLGSRWAQVGTGEAAPPSGTLGSASPLEAGCLVAHGGGRIGSLAHSFPQERLP